MYNIPNNEYELQKNDELNENNFVDLNDGQLKLFIGGLNYLSLKSTKLFKN